MENVDVKVADGKTLRDYINEYMSRAKDDQIHRLSLAVGVDEDKLRNIMSLRLNEANINEFGRYEELKKTVDKAKAKAYFENTEFVRLSPPKVNIKVDNLLREFILSGGFDIKPAIHILDTFEVTEQMVAEGDMEYGHK